MTLRLKNLLGIAVVALALAGCASGVRREADAAGTGGAAPPRLPVGNVTLTLTPQAQKLAAENVKFNQEQLLSTVRRGLAASGLLRDGIGESAEIVLSEFRVRGTFSAVMWGVMAGTDNVTGDVIVRDASGRQVRKFTVNASYGLGGFAGGMDETRLNWLYEKFAEHTVNELAGKGSE